MKKSELKQIIKEELLKESSDDFEFIINKQPDVILQNNGDVSLYIQKSDFKAFKAILKSNKIKYEMGLF